MIPVTKAMEPVDFNRKVRQPGAAFLRRNLKPKSNEWGSHDYWRKALGDLHLAYEDVCAYSGSWTTRYNGNKTDIETSSVDHFVPKSVDSAQAYEWGNFRLSRTRLNNRKANYRDVLDPFQLPGRWFVLDFLSFFVRPNPDLLMSEQARVQRSIDRLGLNADGDYVLERGNVVQGYCSGLRTFQEIKSKWPFIAQEMQAQNFDTTYLPLMTTALKSHRRRT